MITWVDEIIWYGVRITKQMIEESFKYTGISNDLDGSEDFLFKGFYRLITSEAK